MLRKACTFLLMTILTAPVFANDDTDKINGSIRIEANKTVGNLSTVNGSIHLDNNVQAGTLETVNGAIEIGPDSKARSMETVNGHALLEEKAHISQNIEAVNGSITLKQNADVGGHVSNVNGDIQLNAAHVGDGIETVSGDITINRDSKVEGGILVDKPGGWFNQSNRKPRIIIGPNAIIEGKLEFRREVELYVSDSAKTGEIIGATAQKFSGETPT